MRKRAMAEILERAHALLEQEKAAEVVALLGPLVEEHPRSPDAHYLLGYAYAETGDPWGAIEEIERALALGGDRFYVLPLVGLYAGVGLRTHFTRAFRRARRWLADLPTFDAIQETVSTTEEEIAERADELGISIRQMEEGLYHMEEGERALSRNDWSAGISACRRSIRYLGD
jgi:tetratricopeptide (TPR) repeat protein